MIDAEMVPRSGYGVTDSILRSVPHANLGLVIPREVICYVEVEANN